MVYAAQNYYKTGTELLAAMAVGVCTSRVPLLKIHPGFVVGLFNFLLFCVVRCSQQVSERFCELFLRLRRAYV